MLQNPWNQNRQQGVPASPLIPKLRPRPRRAAWHKSTTSPLSSHRHDRTSPACLRSLPLHRQFTPVKPRFMLGLPMWSPNQRGLIKPVAHAFPSQCRIGLLRINDCILQRNVCNVIRILITVVLASLAEGSHAMTIVCIILS